MNARFVLSLSLACLALPACSLAGLDRAVLPVCASDQDCLALALRVDDPDCDTYVCVPETGRCMPAAVDADHDGEPPMSCGGTDCDDHDPARFRGATEICNGIDDDCNDAWDGPDEDDDDDEHIDLCGGPTVADDCDDTDSYTFFAADELCDGIDNDCLIDGVARQGGGRRLEPSEDGDGDGHAAMDATCMAGPAGDARFFVLDDCDDTRAEVYPGADELCDGLDNDCDGVPDDATGTTAPGTTCFPTALIAGGRNTCVRSHEGDLVCFGASGGGELGDLGVLPDAAIIVAAAEGLTSISYGNAGACGVTSDGGVVCWGGSYLFDRQLSSNFAPHAPARISGVADAVEVSVGGSHACARTSTGEVICWGFPCPGRFVDGATFDCTWSLVPTVVADIDDAEQVVCGGQTTCARRAGGAVWCWGSNFDGEIGTGIMAGTPGPVTGIDDAVDLDVGNGFACAERASGELWCWGVNVGCSGAGCTTIRVARSLPLAGTMVDFALGGRHGCVLYDDATFGCWGSNAGAQLAIDDGTIPAVAAPMTASVTGVLEIALGEAHTCVRLADRVRCWGEGASRELGDGRAVHSFPPFIGYVGPRVSVTANAMQIAGGVNDTCFRLPDLSIVCSGEDTFGELGGVFPMGSASPAFGSVPAVDVAVGSFRSCVVRADGRVNCQGDSRYAAGPMADADGFAAGLSDVVDAACGDYHSCLLRRTGEAVCIGLASDGALGDGGAAAETCMGFQACSRVPLPVIGLDRAVSIEAGPEHTCVIRDDGGVWCWGENGRGQTGSVPLGATLEATPVVGLPDGDPAAGLALADESTCALLESGQVWCWGAGFGPASTGFSIDPLPLPGAANAVQIAATRGGLCMRQRSGAVRCVGANASGQLGDGTTTPSATLRTVVGLTDARDLGCGGGHCCATRTSGQTVCWGENAEAQLGDGGGPDRLVPTSVASMIR